jgi:hypothetical protein
MDFEIIKDKTMAALSNPRILTFTLIGTTTMLIGAFLFFGNDAEEPVAEKASVSEVAAVASAVAAPFINENENEAIQEPEQTGGKKKQKKTRRSKKQRKHVSLKNRH